MFTDNPAITEQDLGAILAGLRLLQEHLPDLPSEIEAIATDEGELPLPTAPGIDQLCDKLNFDTLPALPGASATALQELSGTAPGRQPDSLRGQTGSLYVDSENLTELIQTAATQIQRSLYTQDGDVSIEQIQHAIVHWLEFSIEALAEDAAFHCSPSQQPNQFNREAFKHALSKFAATR